MAQSKLTIPDFMFADEADVTELVHFRQEAKIWAQEKGVQLTYLPFIIKAVLSALKKYPMLNASFDEESKEIVLKQTYHMGFAVATDNGLLVPVIRHADQLSVIQLASEINRLAEKTRSGKAALEELQGSTFTITNIGTVGGIMSVPIINYPEVAILGINKIYQKPMVFQGEIAIRWVTTLSLSFDHRVVDGIDGARFTQHVIHLLEHPKWLLME
jgi:pyruvate dehydrogenase E2 component (dihydrolipoamide acetyltransferase)